MIRIGLLPRRSPGKCYGSSAQPHSARFKTPGTIDISAIDPSEASYNIRGSNCRDETLPVTFEIDHFTPLPYDLGVGESTNLRDRANWCAISSWFPAPAPPSYRKGRRRRKVQHLVTGGTSISQDSWCLPYLSPKFWGKKNCVYLGKHVVIIWSCFIQVFFIMYYRYPLVSSNTHGTGKI
jgi:hypothetical protein